MSLFTHTSHNHTSFELSELKMQNETAIESHSDTQLMNLYEKINNLFCIEIGRCKRFVPFQCIVSTVTWTAVFLLLFLTHFSWLLSDESRLAWTKQVGSLDGHFNKINDRVRANQINKCWHLNAAREKKEFELSQGTQNIEIVQQTIPVPWSGVVRRAVLVRVSVNATANALTLSSSVFDRKSAPGRLTGFCRPRIRWVRKRNHHADGRCRSECAKKCKANSIELDFDEWRTTHKIIIYWTICRTTQTYWHR